MILYIVNFRDYRLYSVENQYMALEVGMEKIKGKSIKDVSLEYQQVRCWVTSEESELLRENTVKIMIGQ